MMSWRGYHEFTKHSPESLRRTRHVLDWENMPDPFRHYEGVPLLDLPADPPAPATPMLDVLQGASGSTLAAEGSVFLSQLLYHAAAISASKRIPSTGSKYALRVNPSSGNLHPTEFHFISQGLNQWPDGLYHYRPSSHMAEQRAIGDFSLNCPLRFILTSIVWREAWKYRDRAYRYCLLDIGHAWQALTLAARAMGCQSFATGHFPDDAIAQSLRLNDDEWPFLVVDLHPGSILLSANAASNTAWFGGKANELSKESVDYPRIDEIHSATKLHEVTEFRSASTESDGIGEIQLPVPASSGRAFGDVARIRRSALDFCGGTESMTLVQLSTVLAAANAPLVADFASARFLQLYLYVHRVEGLQPGVYRFWPQKNQLQAIRPGDQRVAAAGLSLGQDLAGNACVAFSMVGDFERATIAFGDRGYRYVFFEAGALGHRLYLAAEALGLGATGIGAFYDDEVHRYLGLTSAAGEVVYHFAIGHPVPDARLQA
ncbi:MAG: SagB/ThcOx family dehydrogenase [Bryobacteraceae bacterium]